MTAVAVWPEKPQPDDLLAWHLADGWIPQVSALKDGARIDGHAACSTLVVRREVTETT